MVIGTVLYLNIKSLNCEGNYGYQIYGWPWEYFVQELADKRFNIAAGEATFSLQYCLYDIGIMIAIVIPTTVLVEIILRRFYYRQEARKD